MVDFAEPWTASLDDEIVGSMFWNNNPPPFDAEGDDLMWWIIGLWKAGTIDSLYAVDLLRSQDLFDIDAAMTGFVAYHEVMAKRHSSLEMDRNHEET